MKILTISAQKPNSTGSGVYLTELIRSFKKKGIENAVVCGIDKNDKIDMGQDVKVYPVHFRTERLPFPVAGMSDLMPYESTRYKDLTEEMQEQFETAFIEEIREAVEEFRPDFILCHHLYFLAALVKEKFPEIPTGALSHGSDLRQFQKNPMQKERIADGIRRMDVLFALHEEQRQLISELFDVDMEKIVTIGTGYNSDIFYNRKYEKSKDEVRLIFAGKICEKKGVFCLLRALDQIKADQKIRLSIAGGYSDEEEYRKITELASEVETEVDFLGRLTQKELAEEFGRSDLFVLPSFFEGLPLVIVEAMACGLKVAATDLPGVRTWIDANVDQNQVVFIQPPVMDNVDDASEEAQEIFQRDLAEKLSDAIADLDGFVTPDTSKISWDHVAEKILGSID